MGREVGRHIEPGKQHPLPQRRSEGDQICKASIRRKDERLAPGIAETGGELQSR
jgi:hypothetical protein